MTRCLPACLLAGLLRSALHKDHVWLQVLAEYAGQSFRLLAVATGALRNVSPDVLAGMDQQQAEACCGPLDLLGLQVLSNHLRPTSRLTVTNLRDRSATSACILLLCCEVLCCAVLCCCVLPCAVMCCASMCCAALHYAVLCYVVAHLSLCMVANSLHWIFLSCRKGFGALECCSIRPISSPQHRHVAHFLLVVMAH